MIRSERIRHLTIREADGNPTAVNVYEIIVTNGTLTDNGDGTVSITIGGGGGGSGFTIQELDGTPSGTCTTLRVPNTFLTNDGGGQFTLTYPASYTDEQAQDAIGTILTDSATIDFTYNDAGNTITATVIVAGLTGIAESQITNLVSDLAARALTTRLLNVTSPITGGGDLSADRTFGFDSAALLDNNARIAIRRNSTGSVFTRRRINLVEGTNVTIAIADDAGNEEVDVTINSSGGGGSANAGQTTVNFGSFPGSFDTSVNVTGQASIASNSIVEVSLAAAATSDHSADEHVMASPFINLIPGNIIAGTGFTIYAVVNDQSFSNPEFYPPQYCTGVQTANGVNTGTRVYPNIDPFRMYGQFTVNWRWS